MTDEEYLKEDDFIENTYDELVDESEDSIFKRDKFLLDMMIHAYEEDERRNTLVDSKNSQMIACIGGYVNNSRFIIHIFVIPIF